MVDSGGHYIQWRFKSNTANRFTARVALARQAGSAEADAFLWSMVDLMTLLLIFFVLLYANAIQSPATATQEQQLTHTTAEGSSAGPSDPSPSQPFAESIPPDETAESNPDPPAANRQSQALADPVELSRPELMNRLKESFSNDFYVRWDDKQPVFVLGERITFNVGDAELLTEAQSALNRIADLLAPLGHGQVIVSGHTDNIAIHTAIYPSNWELSAARAASVAKFLATNGVAPQRLIIQGKSEFHPLVPNTSDEHRRANRRVEITLLKGKQTPERP